MNNVENVKIGTLMPGKKLTDIFESCKTIWFSNEVIPEEDVKNAIEINNKNSKYKVYAVDKDNGLTMVYVSEKGVKIFANKNCSLMFFGAEYLSLIKFENFYTDNVVKMTSMFDKAGTKTDTFTLEGLSNWDVSNVTDMSWMFAHTGKKATSWNIGDISNWDVSKVKKARCMFHAAARYATEIYLGCDPFTFRNRFNIENAEIFLGFAFSFFKHPIERFEPFAELILDEIGDSCICTYNFLGKSEKGFALFSGWQLLPRFEYASQILDWIDLTDKIRIKDINKDLLNSFDYINSLSKETFDADKFILSCMTVHQFCFQIDIPISFNLDDFTDTVALRNYLLANLENVMFTKE